MKTMILMAIGAAALYQVAKYYKINSFKDVKDLACKVKESLS